MCFSFNMWSNKIKLLYIQKKQPGDTNHEGPALQSEHIPVILVQKKTTQKNNNNKENKQICKRKNMYNYNVRKLYNIPTFKHRAGLVYFAVMSYNSSLHSQFVFIFVPILGSILEQCDHAVGDKNRCK